MLNGTLNALRGERGCAREKMKHKVRPLRGEGRFNFAANGARNRVDSNRARTLARSNASEYLYNSICYPDSRAQPTGTLDPDQIRGRVLFPSVALADVEERML